jgi:chemotaxis protein CheC
VTSPLEAHQTDAIAEVFNVGVGHAAAVLSEMVGQEVVMTLPGIQIIKRAALASILPASETPVSSIYQNFDSQFGRGRALLAFPEASSLKLVEILVGNQGIGELTNLEQEALTEVGNIVLNACLASLSTMLGSEMATSVPQFHSLAQWSDLLASEEDSADAVLMLSIQFDLKDQAINGRLMFLLGLRQLRLLTEALEGKLLAS